MKIKGTLIRPKGSGLDNWKPSSVPLFGFIAPEIGRLSKLVNLTLTSTNLTRKLPIQIPNLSSLKFLNLSSNVLSGEIPKVVTGGLPEIEVFNLCNNFSSTLPLEIIKLKQLKHLHLGGNFLTREIPSVYSEIQCLVYLGLNASSIGSTVNGSTSINRKDPIVFGNADVPVASVEPKIILTQASCASASSEDEVKVKEGPNRYSACRKCVGINEIQLTPITENAQMTLDNMEVEENRVMEDQRDVDVSTAHNVEGVLPIGVNQFVPIHIVTSSPGGSVVIGEFGRVEVEFDDVSAVDTFLSDKGVRILLWRNDNKEELVVGEKRSVNYS
ncbi:hypothetical protein NE237_018712 [Protea cynaroides]|uniref:Uncharacterized protein n=1 Tax=Protea cynaroides TaxID=273540 RepID=A0A9Q0KAC1_9MAGN|nr:hypothetical protein NE237_018712 [Protea cynaroides]